MLQLAISNYYFSLISIHLTNILFILFPHYQWSHPQVTAIRKCLLSGLVSLLNFYQLCFTISPFSVNMVYMIVWNDLVNLMKWKFHVLSDKFHMTSFSVYGIWKFSIVLLIKNALTISSDILAFVQTIALHEKLFMRLKFTGSEFAGLQAQT